MKNLTHDEKKELIVKKLEWMNDHVQPGMKEDIPLYIGNKLAEKGFCSKAEGESFANLNREKLIEQIIKTSESNEETFSYDSFITSDEHQLRVEFQKIFKDTFPKEAEIINNLSTFLTLPLSLTSIYTIFPEDFFNLLCDDLPDFEKLVYTIKTVPSELYRKEMLYEDYVRYVTLTLDTCNSILKDFNIPDLDADEVHAVIRKYRNYSTEIYSHITR